MTPCILIGAGAEAGAPFHIPNGQDFTWATCYTQNGRLYEALDNYYSPLLEAFPRDLHLPRKYQPLFLYEADNAEFLALIKGVLNDDGGANLLSEIIGTDYLKRMRDEEKYFKFSSKELRSLYEVIIKDSEKDTQSVLSLKNHLLQDLPDDAYFGTLDGYFSSLINPAKRNRSFWKLINYYWSAFFSVATPLIEHRFSNDALFKKLGIYRFTLNNLFDVVTQLFSDDVLIACEDNSNYYSQLSGLFDYALTTNYTPFVQILKTRTDSEPIRLSGSLAQFESVPELTVYDIRNEKWSSRDSSELIFPFIMTQIPVKPLICYRQMSEYARALDALDSSDTVVILGYSLCKNDAHIGSLLQAFLRRNTSNRLVYLSYKPEETSEIPNQTEILQLIRLSEKHAHQIKVVPMGDTAEVKPNALRDYLEQELKG